MADEISYALPCRLASLVGVHGLRATGEAAYCVCLPEWARPKPPPAPAAPGVASAAAEGPGSAVTCAEVSARYVFHNLQWRICDR